MSCTNDTHRLPALSGAGKMVRRQHPKCLVCLRDLDKQEAEIREKLKQEKKREERKNREAFSELLREDMDEGFIKPKMRWKVIRKTASLTWLFVSSPRVLRAPCIAQSGPCSHSCQCCMHLPTKHQPAEQCSS